MHQRSPDYCSDVKGHCMMYEGSFHIQSRLLLKVEGIIVRRASISYQVTILPAVGTLMVTGGLPLWDSGSFVDV